MILRVIGLYLGEALTFLAATVNIRACAKGWIKSTLATDALIAGLGFTLVKWIAEAGTPIEQLFYIAGAVSGSASGMWITKHWKEE